MRFQFDTRGLILLRRVPPDRWSDDPNRDKPLETAFHRRRHEKGISVYRADQCTGLNVLQRLVAERRDTAFNPKKSEEQRRGALEFLSRTRRGDPACVIDIGWRIVAVHTATLEGRGFELDLDVRDGHQVVIGSPEQFMREAGILADHCVPLSRDLLLEPDHARWELGLDTELSEAADRGWRP